MSINVHDFATHFFGSEVIVVFLCCSLPEGGCLHVLTIASWNSATVWPHWDPQRPEHHCFVRETIGISARNPHVRPVPWWSTLGGCRAQLISMSPKTWVNISTEAHWSLWVWTMSEVVAIFEVDPENISLQDMFCFWGLSFTVLMRRKFPTLGGSWTLQRTCWISQSLCNWF